MENVDGVKKIKATVDGCSIILNEGTIRQCLQFYNATCITILPNDTLFENFSRMGYEGYWRSVKFKKAIVSP